MPRQEDIGSDFHCSLLTREGDNLRPSLPFNIQIKSDGDQVRKEGLRYGGVTKAGVWRKHEIDQLCQTDTPFLVGIVNKDEQWLDIFCTITRYFVLSNWRGTGLPREVALIPYDPTGEGHLGDGVQEDRPVLPNMPQKLWKLPIGQPIVRVSIEDSEDTTRCEEIKALLAPYLRIDQENAICFRIGLGYFNWPLIIRPGQPLREMGVALVAQGVPSQSVENQMKILSRLTASLLRSYQMSGMKANILVWESLTKHLPLENETVLVSGWVNEALNTPARKFFRQHGQYHFLRKLRPIADAPDAVTKMRELVLQLAVQGKLVGQKRSDGDAISCLAPFLASGMHGQQNCAHPRNPHRRMAADIIPRFLPTGHGPNSETSRSKFNTVTRHRPTQCDGNSDASHHRHSEQPS